MTHLLESKFIKLVFLKSGDLFQENLATDIGGFETMIHILWYRFISFQSDDLFQETSLYLQSVILTFCIRKRSRKIFQDDSIFNLAMFFQEIILNIQTWIYKHFWEDLKRWLTFLDPELFILSVILKFFFLKYTLYSDVDLETDLLRFSKMIHIFESRFIHLVSLASGDLVQEIIFIYLI